MCIRIRCSAIKDNLIFPLCSFIFFFISINLPDFSLFKEHIIIKNIYGSFGNILSFIPYLISLKISRNTIAKFNKIQNKKENNTSTSKSLAINYEYNDKLEEVSNIKCSSLFFVSFIDFLQVISFFIEYNKFSANNSIFFWSADIICLFILSKIFLTIPIYRHHLVSLFIFFFFDIYLSCIFIIYSEFNYWQLIFSIINDFLFALKVVYQKKLMYYNYISHFKLCYIIGFITLFFDIITIIIETIIDEKFYISEDYKFLIDNGLKYWDDIMKIEDYKGIIKEIIFIILYIISFGLSNIFLLLTLNHLSPFHTLIPKIFFYVGYNLIIILKDNDISNLSTIIIINICIYGLSIFVLFFFLEIIEFNCCKLNVNTKEQIQERSLNKGDTTLISDKSINESSVSISGENNNTRTSIPYDNTNNTRISIPNDNTNNTRYSIPYETVNSNYTNTNNNTNNIRSSITYTNSMKND